jgi:hypothetical protein
MFALLTTLAMSATSAAPAIGSHAHPLTPEPTPPPATSVIVQNDRSRPVTVYVEQDGFDQRLGTVGAVATATIPLPSVIAEGRQDFQFVVHPKDGFDVTTPDVTVRPGGRIGVLVPPRGEALPPPPNEPVMMDPYPEDPATSVTIRNDGNEHLTVYAEHWEFDTGLGRVAPHTTVTLHVPRSLTGLDGIVLHADRADGYGFETAPLRIAYGHHLGMIVPAL